MNVAIDVLLIPKPLLKCIRNRDLLERHGCFKHPKSKSNIKVGALVFHFSRQKPLEIVNVDHDQYGDNYFIIYSLFVQLIYVTNFSSNLLSMSPRYFLGPKTRMSTARSSDLGPLFWQKGKLCMILDS